MLKQFLCAFFCCLGLAFSGNAGSIAPKDKPVLERFFQTLLSGYEFGYTLFGSKPMSVAFTYHPRELFPEYTILEKGWETWVRYRDEFPSARFFLKKDILKSGELCLTIINKWAASNVINENLELFQSAFGEQSPETILQKICDSENSLFELMGPNTQTIFGILLGYGEKNALNFQREIEVIHELTHRITPPFLVETKSLSPLAQLYLKYYNNQKQTSKRTESTKLLLDETKEVIDKRKSFSLSGTSFFLERFLTPRFACWEENPETAQLKQSYENTRSILSRTYANAPFLETTLQQWVSTKEIK